MLFEVAQEPFEVFRLQKGRDRFHKTAGVYRG
jgi:hypothetical protein